MGGILIIFDISYNIHIICNPSYHIRPPYDHNMIIHDNLTPIFEIASKIFWNSVARAATFLLIEVR